MITRRVRLKNKTFVRRNKRDECREKEENEGGWMCQASVEQKGRDRGNSIVFPRVQ